MRNYGGRHDTSVFCFCAKACTSGVSLLVESFFLFSFLPFFFLFKNQGKNLLSVSMFMMFRRQSHISTEVCSVELVFRTTGFISSLLRVRYCPGSCLQLLLGVMRLLRPVGLTQGWTSWVSSLGPQLLSHHVVELFSNACGLMLGQVWSSS